MTSDISLTELAELDELVPLDLGAADAPEAVEAPPLLLRPDNRLLRTRGILKRRGAAVAGYCGLNGEGKTYNMVRDSLLSLALGRHVLSTVTILDPESGNPHPNFELFTSWQQLHGRSNTDILLDEVTGIMDARDSGMPKHVRKAIPQQRRANNRVAWTGISFDNCDLRLRQISRAMVRSRGFFPKKPKTHGFTEDSITMWPPNRLFYVTTYDGQTLQKREDADRLTEDREKKRRARVLNKEWVYGPGSLAFSCYDTLAAVAGIDNSCSICGGRIPEKTCRGHRDGAPPEFAVNDAGF